MHRIHINRMNELLFCLLLIVFMSSCSLCENELVIKYDLPDTINEIYIFNRSCGATTGNSIQVAFTAFFNNSVKGNVFVAIGVDNVETLIDKTSKTIMFTITGNDIKVFTKIEHIGEWDFVYNYQ